MSETGTDNYICVINPIITAPQQDALPWRVEHTAGDTHPLRHNRSHHLGSNPRRRPPMSRDTAPETVRGAEGLCRHRSPLDGASPEAGGCPDRPAHDPYARRIRHGGDDARQGPNLLLHPGEIGVCHDVIRRELAERGYSTTRIRKERRAKRGIGFWRSFD